MDNSSQQKQASRIDGMILPISVSLLLVVALFDMPYGYYRFLRIAVFIWCGCTILGFFKQGEEESIQKILKLLVISVAILYNPILPVYLDKEIWTVLNLITIPIILASDYFNKKKISE